MTPDLGLLGKLIIPIITAVVVAAINRRMENRPKLITYVAHAAGFVIPPNQGPQPPVAGMNPEGDVAAPTPPTVPGGAVYVHSIIVRNTGKKTAFNVRLGHNLKIEHYVIEPRVQHESKTADPGGWEIIVPSLVPDEQIMVSYLYGPPITWNQINKSCCQTS